MWCGWLLCGPARACRSFPLVRVTQWQLTCTAPHVLPFRQVRKYSGGMKRRLSVAISFIGDPLVVYLDEPSTVCGCARGWWMWSLLLIRMLKWKAGEEGWCAWTSRRRFAAVR